MQMTTDNKGFSQFAMEGQPAYQTPTYSTLIYRLEAQQLDPTPTQEIL